MESSRCAEFSGVIQWIFLAEYLRMFLRVYLCLRVPEEQAPLDGLDVQEDLTYIEHPVKILETSERVTRNKRIKMCRVQWKHHSEAEATWEREDVLRKTYPDLFASQSLEYRDEILVRG